MNWDWDKLEQQRQRQPGGHVPSDFGKLGEGFKKFKNFNIPGWKLLLLLGVVAWVLISGFYIVHPGELGVVQRFGAYSRITEAGPHLKLPYPVESVEVLNVENPRRIEVGFRTTSRQNEYALVPEESHMLTGDENIIDVQFIVQYQINDAKNYLFNISQPEKTVKDAAEAAMRQIIGYNTIDSALTSDKLAIQVDTQTLLQSILDRYECGVKIVTVKMQDVFPPKPVGDAFKDVASAKEDKNRFKNEADAYRNDLIPKTRGEAAAILNDAQAYKESAVRRARGESSRFVALYSAYQTSREVTQKRLYLEAMEEILSSPGLEKIIMSDRALKQAVPYLPLEGSRGRGREAAKGEAKVEVGN